MRPIDLDSAKLAWQSKSYASTDSEQVRQLEACLYSSERRSGLLSPPGLDARLRRAAMLDLGLKASLLFASVLAFVVFDASAGHSLLLVAVGVILAASLAVQWRMFSAIPRIDPGQSSALEIHRSLLEYYDSHGRLSALIQALTAPLFFVVGSSFYLLVKYGALPEPALDDRIVFWSGATIAFLLGFVPLLFVHERQRRYLAANVGELESETLDPARVERYRSGTRRLALALAVLLIAGTGALALLLFGRG